MGDLTLDPMGDLTLDPSWSNRPPDRPPWLALSIKAYRSWVALPLWVRACDLRKTACFAAPHTEV
jgi:hypothetical protein